MFRGRKVTDPLIHGSGGVTRNADVDQTWGQVKKARTELRRIVNRYGNVDFHPHCSLNTTSETNISDYSGPMDFNQTYEVKDQTNFASGVTVDNYGHSKYARSKNKGSSRKVSRLDDKYVEEEDESAENNQQSGHSRHGNVKDNRTVIGSDGNDRDRERGKNRDRDIQKRVEFSDRDPDTMTTQQQDCGQPSSLTSYTNSTLTDSKAIRETDIRFLNDNLSSDTHRTNQTRNLIGETHFSRVDVKVPSLTRKNLSSDQNIPASTLSSDARGSLSIQHPAMGIRLTDTERRSETVSIGSSDSADSGIPRRFRKTLKDLDQGGLDKLKEKIRKQQMKASPREGQENANAAAMGATGGYSHEQVIQHQLHDEADLVGAQSSAYDPTNAEGKHPWLQRRLRKIAAGPPLPTYKGFSETEIKFRYTESRTGEEARRKDKKKKHALKIQEKKQDLECQEREAESKAVKVKKPHRVVATLKDKQKVKEPSKKSEIITTSSWRQGQELILRELGPVRLKKTSQSSRPKMEQGSTDTRHATSEKPMEAAGVREEADGFAVQDVGKMTTTDVELERARVLSEEARKVLTDLHLDGSDQNAEDRVKAKIAMKRKAPKLSEPEKQQPIAKHRHYDQDEVRKYIMKQRADRQRRQKDEERKMKDADDKRRVQLEELKTKQKKSAVRSKSQNRADDYPRAIFLQDLPRHHPFHEDRSRKLFSSGEFEKENRRSRRDDYDHDHSDGSSTITADGSMDDLTPTGTPRDARAQDSKPDSMQASHSTNLTAKGDKQILKESLGNKNNVSIGGLTFDMDGVVSKFGQVLHNRTATDHDRKPLSLNSGYVESVSSMDSAPFSQVDRIQNLKNQAASLTSRIEAEKMKITNIPRSLSENTDQYSYTTQGRWAHPRLGHSDRDTNLYPRPGNTDQDKDHYISRYSRITGGRDDYSVFTSNLPGSSNAPEHHGLSVGDNQEQRAATRIQAAYRGHAVRQSLNWKLPSGQTVGHIIKNKDTEDIGEDTTLTETSTFSDITITEDSDIDSIPSPSHRIGTGLRQRDFHAQEYRNATAQPSRAPTASVGNRQYSWEDPKPDPNSVLNILSRKYKQQERAKSQKKAGSTKSRTESLASLSDLDLQQSTSHKITSPRPHRRSQRSRRDDEISDMSKNVRVLPSHAPKSQGISSRAESIQAAPLDRAKSESQKSHSAAHSVHLASWRGNEDDTLDNESYTQSFESDDQLEGTRSSRSITDKAILQSYSKASASRMVERADTDTSSIEDAPLSRNTDHDVPIRRVSPKGEESLAPREPPRFSPNALERKFYAELNQLESMEESMRQLTGVERTRAVSMAQQETVSLAQILKSQNQTHGQQLHSLQLKAKQEALDSNVQLEEFRKQAAAAAHNAAETISQLRSSPGGPSHEAARKLIETQTEAARATAEATRFLAEARGISHPETKKVSSAEAAGTDNLRRNYKSKKTASQMSTARSVSQSRTSRSHPQGSDHFSHDEADATIQSLVGAEGIDQSKSESILEELSAGYGDDYSLTFDETMSEDEIEERSFRSILPSESHRKKAKTLSDSMSVTSDEGGLDPKLSVDDMSTLFIGEDSFNKFTEDMVRQFMKEEKIRLHHQTALLRLREKALTEKTKAELEWLEMQKHQPRNKGADDIYPQIVKKQRGLKMKLQEQKAKIRKLREANEAASRQRQLLLQQQGVSRKCQSTDKDREVQAARRPGRTGRPLEVQTEDERHAVGEVSDTGDKMMRKDYKSDSEIYTEPISSRSSRAETKVLEKLKKIHFDEKFLTARELKLAERKKNVEELLKWKKQLDEEEMKIFHMERKAMEIWDDKKKKEKSKDGKEPEIPSKRDTRESPTELATVIDADSLVTETVKTAQDDSLYGSVMQDRPPITSGSESSPDEHRRSSTDQIPKRHLRSGSESSIPEEIQSQSSVEEVTQSVSTADKKPTDSSDDTIVNDYGQETFEESTTVTSKKSPMSPPSLSKMGQRMLLGGRELSTSPRAMFRARGSESESEDSISHPETQSDQSDFEGRIRALSDELRRRKIEAEKLKRERKKRKKELMKNKEESLKKQIEAYDNQISQLKADLQEQMEHDPIKASSVKPQIKQPKVSPTKNLKKKDVTPAKPDVTPPKQRADSEGSRSSSSLSFEESRDSLDSLRSPPSYQEEKEKDSKQASPVSKVPPLSKNSLEKISEGSESASLSDKSDKTNKDVSLPSQHIQRKEDTSIQEDRTEITEEILENIENEQSHSDSATGYSGLIMISKHDVTIPGLLADQTEQLDDSSYSLDFTDDHSTPRTSRSDKLARSKFSEHSLYEQPMSARSVTEQTSEGVISEYIRGVISPRSEESVKQFDLKHRQEDEQESDVDARSNSYVTTRSDSRPSSGRSEPSFSSQFSVEYESSESERTPVAEPQPLGQTYTKPDVVSEGKVQSGSKMVTDNLDDIDDLLGPVSDVTDEQTPIASPRISQGFDFYDDESTPAPIETLDPLADFGLGDRVFATGPRGPKKPGTLLFKGKVKFAPGIWAGVHLDKAEGTNDGEYLGERYFRCPQLHGMLVPGDDIIPFYKESEAPGFQVSARSSQDSVLSQESKDNNDIDNEESDLIDLIGQADQSVQQFIESPGPSYAKSMDKQQLADHITDQLFHSVLKENVGAMSEIAARQSAKLSEERIPTTDKVVKNLLDEAVDHMVAIKQRTRSELPELRMVNGHISDDSGHKSLSPNDELQRFPSQEEDGVLEPPQRPESPLPSHQVHDKHSLEALDVDMNGLIDSQEYIDEEPWDHVPNKVPPPYPGEAEIAESELKRLLEDTFYAVPHKKDEIKDLVSLAVDEYWKCRRYGESMEGVRAPDSFFTAEDAQLDMENKSHRVFKKLLFDLTGEIIRDVYKDEDNEHPPPWTKPKRKQQKYFRGISLPTTIDVLKPVVQEAVIDILGLNGSRKADCNKWNIRKKKDHVDKILVQELREEEPQWVDYDDDELAVKMQLSDAILDSLLTDTVQTMNRIIKNKQEQK